MMNSSEINKIFEDFEKSWNASLNLNKEPELAKNFPSITRKILEKESKREFLPSQLTPHQRDF